MWARPLSQYLMQAAQAIGELARENAVDPDYESPYAAEAIKAGHDLGWWEKLSQGRITDGGFKLAHLTVSRQLPSSDAP